MLCVLQMEYLAQMLSAVGIGVAPETLQSIKDAPSEHVSGPITPPRVPVQPAPCAANMLLGRAPIYMSSESMSHGPSGMVGCQGREGMEAEKYLSGLKYRRSLLFV